MAFVYILYSNSLDRYYIGSTIDLEHRLYDHERGNTPSTMKGKPWICVFRQEFTSLHAARVTEIGLKKCKNRSLLERIIKDGVIKKCFT